jgi:hypothetical protein
MALNRDTTLGAVHFVEQPGGQIGYLLQGSSGVSGSGIWGLRGVSWAAAAPGWKETAWQRQSSPGVQQQREETLAAQLAAADAWPLGSSRSFFIACVMRLR